MDSISEYCSLFGEQQASNIDYYFGFLLIEFIILRLYYSFRFPYGFIEHLVKNFPFLNYKNKEKKNEDTQSKVHQNRRVESIWSVILIRSFLYFSIFLTLLYFRMDRFYIVQHTPLKYFTPFTYQLSKIVICSGDITFIPRDSMLGTLIRIIGLLILMSSHTLLFWVHQEMQASWTPVIHLKQDHKLITSGPFQIVRHPMYFSGVIMIIGIGLASWNWILSFSWLCIFLVIFLRIPIEEKLLSETYGAEYQKFRATVNYAVIPYVY